MNVLARAPLLERSLPWLFVVLALPLTVFLAVVVPLGVVPDEPAHAIRARSLAHGQLIGHRRTVFRPEGGPPVIEAGLEVDPALPRVFFLPGHTSDSSTVKVTRATWDPRAAVEWTGTREFCEVAGAAGNSPLLYLPASVALSVARWLSIRPFNAVRASRVVNAIAYVALGVLALGLARRGRRLMFAALLTPMSLFLAGSVSQDGLIIACSVLAAALVTRVEVEPRGASRWLAAAALACVIAAKPPYAALAGIMAATPGPWRARLGGVLLALLPGLLWWGLVGIFTWVPSWHAAYYGGPHWHGAPATIFHAYDPKAQLGVLIREPRLLITLPLRLLLEHRSEQTHQLIGQLGLLDVPLPTWLYRAWYVGFIGALAADGVGDAGTGRRSRWRMVLPIACVIGCAYSIVMSQYLGWTLVGADAIEGVQGRYFLPLLGALALATPLVRWSGRSGVAIKATGTVLLVAAAALGLAVVPAKIVSQYYLH